jgi:hypothetical protein
LLGQESKEAREDIFLQEIPKIMTITLFFLTGSEKGNSPSALLTSTVATMGNRRISSDIKERALALWEA